MSCEEKTYEELGNKQYADQRDFCHFGGGPISCLRDSSFSVSCMAKPSLRSSQDDVLSKYFPERSSNDQILCSKNLCLGRGGAIFSISITTVILRSVFEENWSYPIGNVDSFSKGGDGNGGAVFLQGPPDLNVEVDLEHVVFTNNWAQVCLSCVLKLSFHERWCLLGAFHIEAQCLLPTRRFFRLGEIGPQISCWLAV